MKRMSQWTAVAIGLMAISPADANYFLGTVTNNTANSVTVSSLIGAGQSVTRAGLGRNGFVLAVGVPKSGVIRIWEDATRCPGFTWAANIEYAGSKWGFGYEGDGVINLTLNADNTLTVGGSGTPGGNGRVFPGGC